MANDFSAETRQSLKKATTGVTFIIVGFCLSGAFSLLYYHSFTSFFPLLLNLIGLFVMRSALSNLSLTEEERKARALLILPEEEPMLASESPEQEAVKTEPSKSENKKPDLSAFETDWSDRAMKKESSAQEEPREPSWMETVNWEEWIGKKLLQKLGIIVVLIGMIVLLKYSFDNRWIGELGRIGLSVLAAIGLLGAGEWFHTKYGHWSQAFTGGGIALLYFTVWVADVFYADALLANHGLELSTGAATFLYSLITLIGVLAAIRYDAQIIAWFAMLGGFLTPNLIDTAQATPMGFVIYLTILTSGILGIAWYKRWKFLNLACFILAQFYLQTKIFALPSELFSDAQQLVTAVGFFALFGILPYISQLKKEVIAEGDDIVLVIMNGLIVYWAIIDAVGGIASEYVGLASLALAAVYVGFAGLTLTIRSKSNALINTYLVAAIILIALALFAELEAEWVAVGWAPFSALLVLLATKLKRSGPLPCAMLLLFGSLFFLAYNLPVFHQTEETLWHPFTSPWAIQNYVVFAAVINWIFAVRRLPEAMMPKETQGSTGNILHLLLALMLFVAVTLESTAMEWVVDMPWTLGYILFCAIATVLFALLGSVIWLIAAVIVDIIVLFFIFALNAVIGLPHIFSGGYLPVATPIFHPWAGISLLALLIPVALATAIVRRKQLVPYKQWNTHALMIGIALTQVWIHGTTEILNMRVLYAWGDDLAERILSGWWILFAFALIGWSLFRTSAVIRRAGLLVLCIPLLFDLGLIVEAGDQFYQPVLWTIIVAALALLGTKEKQRDFTVCAIAVLAMIAGADMITHLGYQGAGLLRTIWWAIAALATIIHGFISREALLRRTGIVLFGFVTAKLLIFDFATLETFVRIVASIVTGLLMIGASYLYQRFGSIFEKESPSHSPS